LNPWQRALADYDATTLAENLRIEHTFACNEDTFWNQLFFNEEYNRGMFIGALHFSLWRELSREDRGDAVVRVVECEPPLGELPGPLAKLVGEGLRYREEGRFEKATRRYTVKVIPSKMADKISVEGLIATQPAGEKQCKRIFTATVSAKVFGVGGMLEKRIASDLQRSYDAGARFTGKYLQEKGL
jgi:hypothetical protein